MQTTETISNRLKILASGRFHCSVEALRPDIKMMIDWMSAELGDLYRSLRQSGDVMERRIRQYLQPDTLNRPFPAHTLAYAQPRKNGYMLNPEDDVWQLQTPGNGSNPVFFTPLAPLPLVRGKVRYLACGNILSEHTEHARFMFRAKCQPEQSLAPGIMWIGLQLESNPHQDQQLDLCFQTSALPIEKAQALLAALPLVSWKHAERVLPVTAGLFHDDATEHKYHSKYPDEEFLFLHGIEQQIRSVYNPHFIRMELPAGCETTTPETLRAVFDAEQILEFEKQSLIWVQLVFPAGCPTADLASLSIQLNCFPIINRRLDSTRDFVSTGDRGIEVRALSNADNGRASLQEMGVFFLGMQRVFTRNHDLKPVMFDSFPDSAPGTYALQHGRVEADDVHDLYARLADLTDCIEGSASTLSLINAHVLQDALMKIKDGNRSLAIALRDMPAQDRDMGYYLHLKITDPLLRIFIRFWITQGPYAAGLAQPGDVLRAERTDWSEADTAWVV